MNRMARSVVLILMMAFASGAAIQAGGDKAGTWKAFLPEPAYVELTRRSLDTIGKAAKDAKAPLTELRVEALMLAAYAKSVKDAENTAAFGKGAVALAVAAGMKNNADAARKLALELAAHKSVAGGGTSDLHIAIGDIKDVMMLFANKAKGGEGVHADLFYSPKVKNQNGSEALINALASKKLSDANVGKMAKELELLAYRTAVIAALTLERGPPAAQKGETKAWNDYSIVMRDSAIELADGARKKDGPAIFEASKRLENSCVECHGMFK
jgi:hypothetical protein